MATLKKELREILEKYGIDPQDKSQLWDCHGTLVLYHKAYEIIAAKEKIVFDAPTVIEGNASEKIVSILVIGRMGERFEWSFGEASPANLRSAYPYAMAEKRAKDRVIAKLVGLAQYVYSEDEADEFKNAKPVEEKFTPAQKSIQNTIITRVAQAKDTIELQSVQDEFMSEYNNLPDEMKGVIDDQFNNRKEQISKGIAPTVISHKFVNVSDAKQWFENSMKAVRSLVNEKQVNEWEDRNRPQINGLGALKAEVHKVEGKLPKERLMELILQKRASFAPIG